PASAEPIPLFCDNNGAIAQAKEPRSHNKSKHIEKKYHIIRDIVERQDITLQRVNTHDNVADPLTKPMTQGVLSRHMERMGIRYNGEWH
ncbi:Ty1/Copia family ribonuclease HI, partial [Clostridioides difficile]|uniref:Ty1/Copia family ribonuclease HI n=1 Tax=Clostridioides difficile TaxID=1496 RepID=UPI00211579AC